MGGWHRELVVRTQWEGERATIRRCLRSHSSEATAVRWEGLRDALTAQSLQQKNLRPLRGLPGAAEAVPGRVGCGAVGDRPPPGDLSPHRMALG